MRRPITTKTRKDPDGMHWLPGPCLYCDTDAADVIENDGFLLICPKCQFTSGPHGTYGIAVRGWRCGLISGPLTILHWLADEADAMFYGKAEADHGMLIDAIEAARWTLETEA